MPSPKLGSPFRRLRAATAIGALGDGLAVVALPLLTLNITRDPIELAGVVIALYLPWALAALAGAAALGHGDRRTVMGALGTLRAVTVTAVGAVELLGKESLPLVYGAAFVLGWSQTVADEAAAEAVPRLVRRPEVPEAGRRIANVGLLADGFVGVPVGGFLFSLVPAAPVLLDTFSYALAALLLLLLPPVPSPPAYRQRLALAIRKQVRKRRRAAIPLAVTEAGRSFAGTAAFSVLVLVATDDLLLEGTGFGLLLTGLCAGTLAGAWIAPELGRRIGPGAGMATLLTVAAAGYGVATGVNGVGPVAGGLVAGATGTAGAGVLAAAVRHAVAGPAAPEVTRRFRLLGWGALPVGALAGGIAAKVAEPRASFAVAAGACVIAAVAAVVAGSRAKALDADTAT